jgi:hypothetical protein
VGESTCWRRVNRDVGTTGRKGGVLQRRLIQPGPMEVRQRLVMCWVVVLGYKKQRDSWSHHQTTTHRLFSSSQLLLFSTMSLVNSRRYITTAGPTVTRPTGPRPSGAGGLPYPSTQQVCEFLIVSSWLTLTGIHRSSILPQGWQKIIVGLGWMGWSLTTSSFNSLSSPSTVSTPSVARTSRERNGYSTISCKEVSQITRWWIVLSMRRLGP